MDPSVVVDASGLMCPLPTLRARQALLKIGLGDRLQLISTDSGSQYDIQSFCDQNRHVLHSSKCIDRRWHFIIEKGS